MKRLNSVSCKMTNSIVNHGNLLHIVSTGGHTTQFEKGSAHSGTVQSQY